MGRFVAGTVDETRERGIASLYRYDSVAWKSWRAVC